MAKSNKTNKKIPREQFEMDNEKLMNDIQSMNFNTVDEINEYLQKHVNGKTPDEIIDRKMGRKTNSQKSDELVYKAYELEDIAEIEKILSKALKLNPRNVRALNIMGNISTDILEAREWYYQAMEIGKEDFGEDFFKENKGHFWLIHETRPYMTAKYNLALLLIELEEMGEALKHMEELIELNPSDNQGVRDKLSLLYLHEKQFFKYQKLYRNYKDSSAFSLFTQLLYLLITEGATKKAEKIYIKANKANEHVIPLILNIKEMDLDEVYEAYEWGSSEEANIYLYDSLYVWTKYKKALNELLRLIDKL
jgi:tetratricopeptide (TPR) repeat protein